MCTSQLDWHAAVGTSHIPGAVAECPGYVFNHALQAGADKRCTGDYALRRMSLCRGLGIMDLQSAVTGGINT